MCLSRGKNPSKLTIHKLWVKSAGHCQFEGCNEALFIDGVTLQELNKANVAHIAASSTDGPRGNNQSTELSNKFENLMLLCPTHHKLVDDMPDEFTAEILQKMKLEQESKIEDLLATVNYPKTEIIRLESPIKQQSVQIVYNKAVEAVRKCKKNPESTH